MFVILSRGLPRGFREFPSIEYDRDGAIKKSEKNGRSFAAIKGGIPASCHWSRREAFSNSL